MCRGVRGLRRLAATPRLRTKGVSPAGHPAPARARCACWREAIPFALGAKPPKSSSNSTKTPSVPLPMDEIHCRMCSATVYEISRLDTPWEVHRSNMMHTIQHQYVERDTGPLCTADAMQRWVHTIPLLRTCPRKGCLALSALNQSPPALPAPEDLCMAYPLVATRTRDKQI